jgi:hypothetical protein
MEYQNSGKIQSNTIRKRTFGWNYGYLHILNYYDWGESGFRVWTQGFTLTRQALYHWRHASSPFVSLWLFWRYGLFPCSPRLWSSYFRPLLWLGHLASFPLRSGLKLFLPRLAKKHNCPDLSPPCSLGWQACTTAPSFWLKWDLLNFFAQAGLKPWSPWS